MRKNFIYSLLPFAFIAYQANAATKSQPSIEVNMEAISNLKNDVSVSRKNSVIPLSVPTSSIRPNEAVPSLPSSPLLTPYAEKHFLVNPNKAGLGNNVPVNNAPVVPQKIAASALPQQSEPATPPVEPKIGYIETGAEIHSLTGGFPNWSGEYVKGEIKTSDKNSWNAELTNQKKFGDGGVYGSIGNTHTFDENWFTNLNIGAGSDAVFLPRYRVDAFLNRRWGDEKKLITTVGIGTYKAQKTYDDKNVSFGATYYFAEPFILQGGIRFNRSDPKSVYSSSEYIAVTQGRAQEHFITLRYGFGKEAYELQGANVGINDFYSHEASLNWRQWISEDWGFNLRAEFYHNPSYIRRGIALGIFREF